MSWASVGSAAVDGNKIRPRVIIVRHGEKASPSPTYDFLMVEGLQQGLHHASLKQSFSSIKVLHLATEQLSPMARFRRLKELICREMDEMRLIRKSFGCLYSAVHLSQFFYMAVAHTAASLSQPFDFMIASRQGNEIQPDFVNHLSTFLQIGEGHKAPRDALMAFIASNILFDAYPPKMHGETLLA